jgi:hypothetical protein
LAAAVDGAADGTATAGAGGFGQHGGGGGGGRGQHAGGHALRKPPCMWRNPSAIPPGYITDEFT